MENASKALLIAGGILITIIIISIGVGLYTLFSKQSKEYSQIMDNTEVQKFNSNFEVFIGREDITAQEIVSVFNLAKEYDNKIDIIVTVNGINQNLSKSEDFLKNNLDSIFKCIAVNDLNNENPKYDETGRIIRLCITKKNI